MPGSRFRSEALPNPRSLRSGGFSLSFSHETTVQNQPSPSEDLASSYPLPDAIRAGLHRATPADAAAVRDLTRAAYTKWVPLLGRELKPMTADYDVAVRDHIVGMLYVGGNRDRRAVLHAVSGHEGHLLRT